MKISGCLLMTILSISSSADMQTIRKNIFSGEALFLSLPQEFNGCTLIHGEYKCPVFSHPNQENLALAILAASLDASDKNQNIAIQCKNSKTRKPQVELIQIEPDYPVESLSVNPDLVTPPDHAITRINKEREQIRSALACQHPERPLTSAFALPVPLKKVTSPFGIRRLYNGQLKNRHTGIDFRAATGTPVCAPHDGIVRMAQNNWYTGGHIVLEHGWGVSSSYFHLSELLVDVGDSVSIGQRVALSGATGRVTGPHLHWGIHINGTPVNPMQFVLDSIELFSGL